ncbi:hypothetical protein EVAR_76346_1 [Eumeta japonica]|uniref:Uncharacterized protein n=1 Tax=Eumeta variegata TaxID=151549 RepID=A0A4C1T8I5_EUMVA|nr:hypothetical protein EVAR_76346_1 [Eumeta japonica]
MSVPVAHFLFFFTLAFHRLNPPSVTYTFPLQEASNAQMTALRLRMSQDASSPALTGPLARPAAPPRPRYILRRRVSARPLSRMTYWFHAKNHASRTDDARRPEARSRRPTAPTPAADNELIVARGSYGVSTENVHEKDACAEDMSGIFKGCS